MNATDYQMDLLNEGGAAESGAQSPKGAGRSLSF